MSKLTTAQNITAIQQGDLKLNAKNLDIIRMTQCPPHISNSEFEQFIHICKHVGLNPLLKQIYCFIFNPKDRDKRTLTPVTSIHGLTAVANRTGDFRPNDKVATFEVDPEERNKLTNPAGLISAETGCYVYKHGEWHFVPEIAYWEEYAPIIEKKWEYDQKAGKRKLMDCEPQLEPGKTGWKKMPRVMLAKCALARAIRAAFPTDCASLYVQDEMDLSSATLDLTATEVIEEYHQEKRMQAIGGEGILIDWMDGNPPARVLVNEFHGMAMDFIKKNREEPAAVHAWQDQNREALREFWAKKQNEAYNIKAEIEKLPSPVKQE